MDDKDLYSGLIAQEPKTQALLETSAAVIEGLIKAFDDYKI
jgi:hypothetical protein